MLRSSRLAAAVSLLAAASFATASAQDATELDKQMDIMSDAYRALSKELRTPDAAKTSDYLAQLQTIQETALKSKAMVPAKANAMSEPEKGALIVGYRKDMISFIEVTFKAERALLDGDLAGATAAIESLKDLKSEGHDKYQE